MYDLEFTGKPEMLSKDSVFIPTGFDSLMLIEALCKGVPAFENRLFEEVIKKPSIQGPVV